VSLSVVETEPAICDMEEQINRHKPLGTPVYVSLGSNIDKERNLRAGIAEIKRLYGDVFLSSVYESDPVGFVGDAFYNMVLLFHTEQPLAQVANQLREIEFAHGRPKQAKKFSSRTLDLDILLFGNTVCQTPIQLPREEICFNAFVLWPLAEIAPELKHPTTQLTLQSMWQVFDKSTQKLRKIPLNF